jgi:hypothetical protein
MQSIYGVNAIPVMTKSEVPEQPISSHEIAWSDVVVAILSFDVLPVRRES